MIDPTEPNITQRISSFQGILISKNNSSSQNELYRLDSSDRMKIKRRIKYILESFIPLANIPLSLQLLFCSRNNKEIFDLITTVLNSENVCKKEVKYFSNSIFVCLKS
jgi:hypothetical protein